MLGILLILAVLLFLLIPKDTEEDVKDVEEMLEEILFLSDDDEDIW